MLFYEDSLNSITDILKDTELTIKTMNASMRGRNSDQRFEAIKAYSNKLQVKSFKYDVLLLELYL